MKLPEYPVVPVGFKSWELQEFYKPHGIPVIQKHCVFQRYVGYWSEVRDGYPPEGEAVLIASLYPKSVKPESDAQLELVGGAAQHTIAQRLADYEQKEYTKALEAATQKQDSGFEEAPTEEQPAEIDRSLSVIRESYKLVNKEAERALYKTIYDGLAAEKETTPDGIPQHEAGAKCDAGKVRASLLQQFGRALLATAEVATFGADKYTDGGWQHVANGQQRYLDALYRHLLKMNFEEVDSDSGFDHMYHVAWNALAILELKLREKEQ